MPPIKIVRVITRLNIGGPARHATLLTSNLNEGIFESKLIAGITDAHEGDMSFLIEKHGAHVIRVDSLCNGSGPIGDLKTFRRLYQVIKREKPDLVHLHLLKARFFGGLAAKLARVPVIVETFHGNLFSDYYGKLTTAAILAAERFLGWLIMDRVIAISETQKDELARYRICPREKISVIPLGLDLDRFVQCSKFRGELRKELGLAERTLLIGTVGRLVPIKGLSFLLKAVQNLVRTTNVDFCLLIVGDGLIRKDLELQVSSLGIEKKVRFLGWRFDLEKVYADLEVVVLSSLNEGTPVSLIEAMAAGKAVVATKVGGVADLVENGKTGLLVPSKDSDALASAILRLLNDNNFRRCMGEKARVSVRSKYDVSRLIQEMKKFYLGLVPSSKSESWEAGKLKS